MIIRTQKIIKNIISALFFFTKENLKKLKFNKLKKFFICNIINYI